MSSGGREQLSVWCRSDTGLPLKAARARFPNAQMYACKCCKRLHIIVILSIIARIRRHHYHHHHHHHRRHHDWLLAYRQTDTSAGARSQSRDLQSDGRSRAAEAHECHDGIEALTALPNLFLNNKRLPHRKKDRNRNGQEPGNGHRPQSLSESGALIKCN